VDSDDCQSFRAGARPTGDRIALRTMAIMNRISPHDSVIFVNRRERQLVPNACYIIGDGNGATCKRYRPPIYGAGRPTRRTSHRACAREDPDIIGRVQDRADDVRRLRPPRGGEAGAARPKAQLSKSTIFLETINYLLVNVCISMRSAHAAEIAQRDADERRTASSTASVKLPGRPDWCRPSSLVTIVP
jgi:hypothetical protein